MTDAYASLEPPKEPPVDDLLRSVGALQGDMRRAQEGSVDIAKRKQAADAKIINEADTRAEQDRGIAVKHLEAQGVEAEKMKPWDAEKEREKHISAPLEAFGSYASIFAIAASAFTKTPAVNALSASAAAMNAIKANDEKEYTRAFTAYKENMDLVKKRFDMQHAQYGEALQLMTHDQNAGRIKLANTAVKFGDEQAILMFETGNDKGFIDLQNSRMKSFEESYKISKTVIEDTYRDAAFEARNKENNPSDDPRIKTENWLWSRGVREEPKKKLFYDYIGTTNPDGTPKTPEQGARFLRNMDAGSRTPKAAAYQTYVDEYRQANDGRDPPSEAIRAWEAEWDRATKTAAGNASTKTAARQAYMAAAKARGEDVTDQDLKKWEADYNESVKPKPAPTLKQQQIDAIMNRPENRDEYGNPRIDKVQAEAMLSQELLKRTFSPSEVKQIVSVPTLLDNLDLLHRFADASGVFTGELKALGVKLGLGNDPATIFNNARDQARAAAAQWGGSSQRLKSQVETALNVLPKTWQATNYNRVAAQRESQKVVDEVQSWLSVSEKQGKRLDEGTLEKFMERGIYPSSVKDRDPIAKLHNDPKTLTEAEFNRLLDHMTSLSSPDRRVLVEEQDRRAQEWEQQKLRNLPQPILGPR